MEEGSLAWIRDADNVDELFVRLDTKLKGGWLAMPTTSPSGTTGLPVTVGFEVNQRLWIGTIKTDGSSGSVQPVENVTEAEAKSAVTTLHWEKDEDFLAMLKGKIHPMAALRRGVLRVSGDRTVLFKLRPLVALFREQRRSKGRPQGRVQSSPGESTEEHQVGSGSPPPPALAPRSHWVPDAVSPACQQCARPFTLVRRRHHCRFCARLLCGACSACRLRGARACAKCHHQALQSIRSPAPSSNSTFGHTPRSARSETETTAPNSEGEVEDSVEDSLEDLAEDPRKQIEALQKKVRELSQLATRQDELLLKSASLSLSPISLLGWWTTPLAALLTLFLYSTLLLPSTPTGLSGYLSVCLACLLLWALLASLCVALCPQRTQMFRRRTQVYTLALTCIIRTKLTEWQAERMTEEYGTALWELTHRKNADAIYCMITQLRGYWLKVGQYLSTRPEILPQAYVTLLTRLQDQAPSTPFIQVKELVETELGEPLDSTFVSFDPTPLASASIAQVHHAVLRSSPDGFETVEVAVKVQHPGVRALILQDMDNMSIVCKMIRAAGSPLDMEQVVEEYRSECLKEVDFTIEASNLEKCGANLMASQSSVKVPEVIPSLVCGPVLGMKFIKGRKLVDCDVDKERMAELLQQVIGSFAQQILVDGFFNADPHPGNIFVEDGDDGSEGTGAVVLLDWGLVKTLPDQVRTAFARMIHSAATSDLAQLMDAFQEMGLELTRDDPEKDMQGLFYLFRETVLPEEGRAMFDERRRMQRQMASRVMEQDNSGGSQSKKKRSKKGGGGVVQKYPSELILFGRTVLMLRGLCAFAGVRVNFLPIFARYAEQAIAGVAIELHSSADPPDQQKTHFVINSQDPNVQNQDSSIPTLSGVGDTIFGAVESKKVDSASGTIGPHSALKISAFMDALTANQSGSGLQVEVWESGRSVLSVASGVQGPLQRRPVTSGTAFPLLQLSQGILTILTLSMAESGLLRLDDPISKLLGIKNSDILSNSTPSTKTGSFLSLSASASFVWTTGRRVGVPVNKGFGAGGAAGAGTGAFGGSDGADVGGLGSGGGNCGNGGGSSKNGGENTSSSEDAKRDGNQVEEKTKQGVKMEEDGDSGPSLRDLLGYASGLEAYPPPESFTPSKRYSLSPDASWTVITEHIRQSVTKLIRERMQGKPSKSGSETVSLVDQPRSSPTGKDLHPESQDSPPAISDTTLPSPSPPSSPLSAHTNRVSHSQSLSPDADPALAPTLPYELLHLGLVWGWTLAHILQRAISKHLLKTSEKKDADVLGWAVSHLALRFDLPEQEVQEVLDPLLMRAFDSSPDFGDKSEFLSRDGKRPVAGIQVKQMCVGGKTFGGSGQWNKEAWLSGVKVTEVNKFSESRSTHDKDGRGRGSAVFIPEWIKNNASCLDPRTLRQLDAMSAPSLQGVASARSIARLYSRLLSTVDSNPEAGSENIGVLDEDNDAQVVARQCGPQKKSNKAVLWPSPLSNDSEESGSDHPCMVSTMRPFKSIVSEMMASPSSSCISTLAGDRVEMGLGHRKYGLVYSLQGESSNNIAEDPEVVEAFGHEAMGGSALVLCIPSKDLVIGVTSNVLSASNDSDGGSSRCESNNARQTTNQILAAYGLSLECW